MVSEVWKTKSAKLLTEPTYLRKTFFSTRASQIVGCQNIVTSLDGKFMSTVSYLGSRQAMLLKNSRPSWNNKLNERDTSLLPYVLVLFNRWKESTSGENQIAYVSLPCKLKLVFTIIEFKIILSFFCNLLSTSSCMFSLPMRHKPRPAMKSRSFVHHNTRQPKC